MPNRTSSHHNNYAIYFTIAVLLCSLFVFMTCTPAPATPVKPPETKPATEVPETTPGTPPQQEVSRWKADNVISENEYDRLESYDNDNYEIAWASDAEYLYVFMRAKTSGFVAIGFQPDTTMQNADIIIGAVKEGKAAVTDEYSAQAFGPHLPDTNFEGGTDDIIEYSGAESGGYSIFEFKRKLNTGDVFDHPVKTGINKTIWSYGTTDDISVKHISRGYGQIEL